MADEELWWPFPDAAAFAMLRSLTKLALWFNHEDGFCLADIVSALVPLTGLLELFVHIHQPDVVPAALTQLKGLRSLRLRLFEPLVHSASPKQGSSNWTARPSQAGWCILCLVATQSWVEA